MRTATLLLLIAGALLAQDKEPKVWVRAPVEDLLALFPDKGAGYLISVEEYEKLRGLAEENREAERRRPPVDARLVRGSARGRLVGDRLVVEAEYVAVSTAEGKTELPFPVEGIAVLSVEGAEYAGGVLRFDGPGSHPVYVRLAREAKASSDGIRRASFALPPATAHAVTLELPPRVEGEVGPIVRAFQSGRDGGTVTGYPDRSGAFRFWMRPRTLARRLEPIVSARFAVMASVGETRTLASTRVELEVLRAPIREAAIELPKGQLVHALTGKGVKTWRLERGDERDLLRIGFVEPVQDKVVLTLETELPRDDASKAALPFPVVRDAVRYRGTVGLVARPEVRVKALRAAGARRLDRLPKGGVALYEVYDPAATLEASVEAVAAETKAKVHAFLGLGEGGKSLEITTVYEIAGKPLFRLEPRVPAGWTLRGPVLFDGGEIPHRQVDGRLVLEFPNGVAPGRHVLHVRLDTAEVDWVPDDGEAAFLFEGVSSGLEEESGVLAVASDPSFRVSVAEESGLRRIGLAELQGPVHEQTLYAWSYELTEPRVSFTVRRHEPQLTATVIQRAYPRERQLRMHATVALNIERAGIRELKVELPKGTGQPVGFDGPLIEERNPPPDGADPETWTLVFQRRIRGLYRLEIRHERKFDEDRWEAKVPLVRLPGTQESGFVVIGAPSMTEVTVQRGGLREADVAELPQPPATPPLEVLSYARHPAEVTLSSMRHDPQSVLQAIALSAHIYGVVAPDGRLRCRAEYRVRNNDQPFLRCRLPEKSALVGALVDGEPIKPLLEKGVLKLPLARSEGRQAPFVVALVYESEVEALGDTAELTIARPALDIDVLKTTYSLHLPEGYELTGHDGDMVPMDEREKKIVMEALLGAAAKPVAAAADAAPARALADAEDGRVMESRERKARPGAGSDRRRDAREEPEEDADYELEESAKAEKKSFGKKVRDELGRPADKGAPAAEPAQRPKSKDAPVTGLEARAGGTRGVPPPEETEDVPPPRKQPERALLSLDVQFLKPDNVVRLDSLAPTGAVTIAVAQKQVFDVRGYLGAVLGLAFGVVFLLASRPSLLRVVPAAVLLVAALHFAGLSFLSAEFAIGAAAALSLVLLAALALRVPALLRWTWQRLRRIRWPRRPASGAAALLLTAALGHAEEIIAPYSGGDPGEIDRVFLPSDRYHELRRLAYPETAGRRTVVADAIYAVVREGNDVTVHARYTVVKETDAAERIPLQLKDVAVTKAAIGEKPATLSVDDKHGYLLVLKGAGTYELELELRPRLDKSGETSSFAIPVRPVATATASVTHAIENAELDVAALGGADEGTWRLGPVSTLRVSWTPKTEGPIAPAAELRAETYLQCAIRHGFTAVAGRVRYAIAGGEVSRVQIAVDPSLTVRHVSCKDLAGWEVGDDGTLTVALEKPAARDLAVHVLAERRAEEPLRTESAPRFEPLGVVRDTGTITLETVAELKLEIEESQGLLRGTLPRKAPKFRATPEWGTAHSVHRYAVRPFTLRWRVLSEPTRLRAEAKTYLLMRPEEVAAVVDMTVVTERGPGDFELVVGVPPDYVVENVDGPHLRDWWVDDGRLHVARLSRKNRNARYRITLRRPGSTAQPVPAPALALVDAVRQKGEVQVRVEDGYEVDTGDSSGLLPVNLDRIRKPGTDRLLARAYRYVAVPWSLSIATRRERREMDALAVTRVVPNGDGVRVEALVNFHVRGGLVDEVSFTVPVADENAAVVVSPDAREQKMEGVEGAVRYTLVLRNPTRGSVAATVSYDVPAGEPVLGVEPIGVSQMRRYVIVDKIAEGEVRVEERRGLDAVEFADLPIVPPGASRSEAAATFVGTGEPFRFLVAVKTHHFEEVEPAFVNSASAQVVVDRSGWTRASVSYRVYNRTRQFLELDLPDGAVLYAVLVRGEGVRPLRRGGMVLVPLPKVAIGAPPFDVEVTYAYETKALAERDWDARLPEVAGIDVRRTTISLYVPKGYDYEFETEMDEVEPADIAVGQATDLVEEIKDLYVVAERGSAIQARRALQNAAQLEREAKRVAEEVTAQSQDKDQLAKIEAGTRVLDSLRRQREELKKEGKAAANETRGIFDELGRRRAQTVESWKVNDAYLAQNKQEQQDALKNFDAANRRGRGGAGTFRGPSGGVPPGLRDPNDPEPPAPPPTDPGSPLFYDSKAGAVFGGQAEEAPKPADDAPFAGPSTNTAIGLGGGGGGKFAEGRGQTGGERFKYAQDEDGIARLDDVTSGLDDTAFYEPRGSAGRAVQLLEGLQRGAGRVSLRIELPREGEVFHFAASGARSELVVEADEVDSAVGEGLLALLLLAASLFVLFGRKR